MMDEVLRELSQIKNMSEFPVITDEVKDTDNVYINRNGNLYQASSKKIKSENDNIDLTHIPYTNPAYPDIATIQDALNLLLHKEITVSFTYSADLNQQKGNVLYGFTIAWEYSQNNVQTQSINDGNIHKDIRVYTDPATVTDSKTYTFKYSDGVENYTKTINLKFSDAVFFGSSSDPGTSETIFATLEKRASENNQITYTTNAGEGQYLYYACPVGYPDPSFFIDPFVVSFNKVGNAIPYSNGSYSALYKVFRSTYPGLGETTVKVS